MALGSVPATSQAANITGAQLEDFLKVMVTQLRNQDPLDPINNQDFIAQLAQFASLEQTRQMSANVETLLKTDGASQALSLLGKSVDVQLDDGAFSGVVQSLDFRAGDPLVTVLLDGNKGTASNLRLSQVIAARLPK